MVSYNNSNVIQFMRQYEMFANSLNLVKTREEKDMVIKQLTKLEIKIIELTNEIYEEEYYALVNKECGLLDEEKRRIVMLMDLINQRLSYVEKRCNDHYQLTGDTLEISDILGTNTLDVLEEKLKIIDKYSKNIKLQSELKNEVKSLSSKIALASEKIDINKSLNVELESKFKKIMANAFEKYNMYDLLSDRENIEYAYYETEKSLTLAELNLETAKTSPINILTDCQEILADVRKDYAKYKEKISILKLMEIFNRDVDTYDELYAKRREINELFKHIKEAEFVADVKNIVDEQFNTISMEQQDINTFEDLTLEKERKMEVLSEIEKENNSEKFQKILKVLIENEKKRQEKLEEEQRKIEEEEKKKRLEIERKKQEEILKRQKIIEEARKKEIEKRTKQLLEQQQNSVLQGKKKENLVSFETIKENSSDVIEEDSKDINTELKEKESLLEKIKYNDEVFDTEEDYQDDLNISEETTLEDYEDIPVVKNREDIEKELFAEFKDNHDDEDIDDFELNDNKLPSGSIDEYMKNFNENEVDTDGLFVEDAFPTIPM